MIPGWREADWETLFSYTERIRVASGDILIRREASERALYFLTAGMLEVTAVLGSHSLGPIAKVHPGTVVGEIAFLDGMPRSAKVWAVTDSELYRLDFAAERAEHALPERVRLADAGTIHGLLPHGRVDHYEPAPGIEEEPRHLLAVVRLTFQRRHPDVRVRIVSGTSAQTMDALRSHHAELGVVGGPGRGALSRYQG